MTDRAEIERLLNQTGRTLDEIRQSLLVCADGKCSPEACPFYPELDCESVLMRAAADLIERLEDKRPKRQNVKFAPCVCGFNKRVEWCNCVERAWFYECIKCGLTSNKYAAKTKIEAKIGWNKMIEELKAGEAHD